MSKFIVFIITGLLLRLVFSVFIYSGDVNNHMGWGESILSQGGRGAYDRHYSGIMQPTYPPLALHSFVTADWLYKNTYSIAQSLNHSFPIFPSRLIWLLEDQDVRPAFFKVISEISDIGITILIYILARRLVNTSRGAALTAATVYLFNPAVWYNSSLWGQLESPPLFFVLLSIYLIAKKKPLWAHLAFASALLFKQSTIIFLPAFILYSYFKSGIKSTLFGIVSQLLLFIFAYFPFLDLNSPFSILRSPFSIYLHRIEVGSGSNYISDHAFNLWALYTHLEKIPDTLKLIGGYSANLLSRVVFICIYSLLLLRYLVTRKSNQIGSLMGLSGLIAFLVLTRMHERYLAPALPFFAITAAASPQMWPLYLLTSIGHLVNMYHDWWYPTLMWLRPVMLHSNTIYFTIMVFTATAISWTALYYDQTRKK